MSDNKRIAKNTMLLYFRMLLIMGVSLYMSRVVLDKLGVEDYGLYNVVGGVVTMLSFLSGTLSTGSSRFITYQLGVNDNLLLKRTFSTAFYTHVILSLFIVVIMESAGLWFFYNKLVIPVDRVCACLWVFHISIITTVISICQVPYTSLIMAHEEMGIYAKISIFDAFARLGICYMLSVTDADKLILYAILLLFVQIIVVSLYVFSCIRKFYESRHLRSFDRKIFSQLMSFSGWNIMANLSETLGRQGIIILINMFLTPVVVVAQSLASQVATAVMLFVNNFRTAINPQIIKLYASGNESDSRKLTLNSTVYCFDLLLMIGLPAIFIMEPLMRIWLVEVPKYSVVFTQWIIAIQIVGTFNASFYTPMIAANKLKLNSMAAVFLGIGQFVLLYFLLKQGVGPMWIQYLGILGVASFSLIIKPYVLLKEINYSFRELMLCYFSCLKVLFLSMLFSLPAVFVLSDSVIQSFVKAITIAIAVMISSYICLEKSVKQEIVLYTKNKISKKYNNRQTA